MVFLEQFRNPLCFIDGRPAPKLLLPPPGKDHTRNDPTSKRRISLSNNGWSLFGPAVRILRGGVDAVNATVLQLRDGSTEEERIARAKWSERRQILQARMKHATTMDQWTNAATELDILEDNEAWKQEPESDEYDVEVLLDRMKQQDEARINCDVGAMLQLVRQALCRDMGGMGNIRLYKHSHIGTKDLIERYIDCTIDTIRSLVETSKHSLPEGVHARDVLDQVVLARQSFGRSALLLSGGATFGMNHIGVLKALFEADLLPRIISGTSAGSIVCAVLCSRMDEEIPEVLRSFPYGDLAVFEEHGREDSLFQHFQRLFTEGAWIDVKHLKRVMQDLLGDMTFQEAYNRTRRILNITVSSASAFELPRLLNYVTAPNVMIWSAVAASCSVPFIFSAAQLLVKNPVTGEHMPWNPTPQKWIDGSVDNDLPMTKLAELFNVNHFIVSQVNPHVVPFLVKDDEAITRDVQVPEEKGPGWVFTLTNLAKSEALHRMQVLTDLGIMPNLLSKVQSILSQRYSGDITILPTIEYKDFPRILKNPTSDFMVQACLCGERATWPKLSRIRNHCAIELELDAAVQALRARVVFSPSQVSLRRMTAGSLTSSNRTVRRRRDSGSTLPPISKSIDETVRNGGYGRNGPTLRSGRSHTSLKRAATPGPRTAQPTFMRTTTHNHESEINPFDVLTSVRQNRKDLSAFPEFLTSGEETSVPTPDGDAVNPVSGLPYKTTARSVHEPLDFFSTSQPVTSYTDTILATSPALHKEYSNLAITPGSETGPLMTAISSPKRETKELFHAVAPSERQSQP